MYLCAMSLVLSHVQDRVGTIVLNRPEKRNALSPELVHELKSAFTALNDHENVKVIVLKSADKPFCAGADLAYLTQMRDFSFEENLADSKSLMELFERIYNSSKVTISLVEGPALAGGCGLAGVTDFCIATPEATFGYTESKIGFLPALVMVYLREKVSLTVMNDWLLTGRIFDAHEAAQKGLITKVVDGTEITDYVSTLAHQICSQVSAQSVEGIKFMLKHLPYQREDALKFAANQNAAARGTDDCKKGIDAFLNKQKISW